MRQRIQFTIDIKKQNQNCHNDIGNASFFPHPLFSGGYPEIQTHQKRDDREYKNEYEQKNKRYRFDERAGQSPADIC